MKNVAIACLLIVTAVVPASAATITLSAVNRGWYDETGSSNGSTAGNNYIAGDCGGAVCAGDTGEFRNWFAFNLAGISGPVVAARLLLDIPANNGYTSTSAASETYTVFDVSAANLGLLGSSSLAVYGDLGSGTTYATFLVTAAANGTTASIILNAAALANLNAALGGLFGFGGAITTLNGVADDEYVFGFSGVGGVQTRLEITTSDVVPEPGTCMLLGTGIALLAARRHRKSAA
jgi:PEP-CTERM motif